MKNVSKPSSAQRAANRSVKTRKREARRWLDLLSVFTTNGLPRDRWPGQRLLMPSEGLAIRRAALARLERRDPELFRVVHDVMAEEPGAADLTREQFKARGAIWFARISRLRRAIGRERLSATSGGKVY